MEPATVSEVLRCYAPQYLTRFGDAMSREQKKVLRAVTSCNTRSPGVVCHRCAQCRVWHIICRFCGNRHSVLCQAGKSQHWLAKQEAKRLPRVTTCRSRSSCRHRCSVYCNHLRVNS